MASIVGLLGGLYPDHDTPAAGAKLFVIAVGFDDLVEGEDTIDLGKQLALDGQPVDEFPRPLDGLAILRNAQLGLALSADKRRMKGA